METTYLRASVISRDELALALSDMDESTKERVGIPGLSPEDLAVLLADVARAHKLLRELGIRGGYYLKEYNGRTYVVLKGHAGLRTYLKGTQYLAENPQVVRLGVGPIALREATRFNLVLALTLYTALDVAEYLAGDNTALEELLGDLLYNGTSAALSIVVGGLASATVGIYVTMALPAIGAGLVAGFVVSYLMSTLNEEKEITKKLAKALVATAEAFRGGIVDTEEEIRDAHEGIRPIEVDPDLREDDMEDPPDDEGGIDIDRGERDMDYGEWGDGDFGEEPGEESGGPDGPEDGGDVEFEGNVWEFRLVDPDTGEQLESTEYYELDEEDVIRVGPGDDDLSDDSSN